MASRIDSHRSTPGGASNDVEQDRGQHPSDLPLQPPYSIRSAALADLPRLIELINAAFSVETFFDGTRTDDERLTAMMEKGSILLAEDGDGKLLASVYMERRGARGYLGMLAVDQERQGEGLGRRMVEAAEDRFRRMGCEAVDITVLSLRPELPPIYRGSAIWRQGPRSSSLRDRCGRGSIATAS